MNTTSAALFLCTCPVANQASFETHAAKGLCPGTLKQLDGAG